VEDRGVTSTAAAPARAERRSLLPFVAALAIGAFDLASLGWLAHDSRDFIVARRERLMPVYRLGDTASWRGIAPGQIAGWARPQEAGTYTARPRAELALRLAQPAPPGDLKLTASASALVHPQRLPARDVAVEVNGTRVATWRFASPHVVQHSARIPRTLVGEDGVVRIAFDLGATPSPHELGLGADTRRLGMLLVDWRIDAVAPP
jgi:hypothetical protein